MSEQIQDAQPIQSQHQSSSAATPKPQKAQGSTLDTVLDLIVTVILATAISLLVTKFAPRFLGNEEPKQGVAVIDMEGLTREQVLAMGEAARAGEIEADRMPNLTQKFGNALMDKLNAYSDQGVVVIKSSAVVSLPENVPDLTESIRNELQKEGAMLKRASVE